MDKDVFGSTEFKMIDKRMFHNSTDYSDTANIERFVTLVNTGGEGFTDGTTVNNYQYELCYTIRSWTNTCQSLSGSGTNNNNCGWVESYTNVCITYETEGGSSGNSGGGNSGGGGGTWPFPPSGPGGGGAPCQEEFGASITNSILPIECNPSGGNPWPPLSSRVLYLKEILNLNPNQINWLIANTNRTNEIYDYLQADNSAPRLQIAQDHLEKMMESTEYLSLVVLHAQTGDGAKMWWDDDVWLDDPNNFNLDPYDDYKKLAAAEKILVKQYPTAAFIMNEFNRPMAKDYTIQKFGLSGLNDKSDAFRHAFFQAINTVRVGAYITQQFANAHETEVPNQLLKEEQMDLFNNGIGIAYGQTQSYPASTPSMIADDIYAKVLNGELKYLYPIWPPKYNTSGQIINPAGDPNFYGPNGTNNPSTATHGILAVTLLILTNQ